MSELPVMGSSCALLAVGLALLYIYIYIFFFFLVENPWACYERAICNGLTVGLVLLYIFFFCLKVEHIIFFFF